MQNLNDLNFQKKLEGTKVTVESFMTWKKGFDEEKAAAKARESAEAAARLKGKLTGRQLFIKDASLIDSDVQFREAGELMFQSFNCFLKHLSGSSFNVASLCSRRDRHRGRISVRGLG